MDARRMKASTPNRRLRAGTRVSRTGGRRGRIAFVFSFFSNQQVRDYIVDTPAGREIWSARFTKVCR